MSCNMRSTRPAEKARSPPARNRHAGPKPRLCDRYHSRPARDLYQRSIPWGASLKRSMQSLRGSGRRANEYSDVDRPIGCFLGSDQGRGRQEVPSATGAGTIARPRPAVRPHHDRSSLATMMGQQVNISSAAESWSGAPQAVGANFMGAPHLGTVVRPHLARLCAGRRRLPQAGGGHRQPEDAQRQGRDGPDRLHSEDQPDLRPRSGIALQRLSGGRLHRRGQSAMLSSAQAMGTMAELARRVLPNGMTIEWTDLSFQEATQGNAALLVFPVSVLLAGCSCGPS